MTDGQITAVGVAGAALLGAVIAGVRSLRSDRFDRAVKREVNAITGYEKLVDDLREEVVKVRRDCAADIRRLRDQHDRDKARWAEREERLRERVDELEGQVVALMYRPENTRTRREDDT